MSRSSELLCVWLLSCKSCLSTSTIKTHWSRVHLSSSPSHWSSPSSTVFGATLTCAPSTDENGDVRPRGLLRTTSFPRDRDRISVFGSRRLRVFSVGFLRNVGYCSTFVGRSVGSRRDPRYGELSFLLSHECAHMCTMEGEVFCFGVRAVWLFSRGGFPRIHVAGCLQTFLIFRGVGTHVK